MNKGMVARAELFAASIIWGTSFFVVKNTVTALPPALMLAFRFGIGAIVLGLLFHRRLRGVTMGQALRCGLIGLFLSAAAVVQTIGITDTTPGKNAFLTAVYCMIVPFLFWLVRGQKPAAKSFFAAAVCLVGIALVSLDGDMTVRFGDWMTLVSGFLFACHIVSVACVGGDMDPVALSVMQFAYAAVFCLVAHFCMEAPVALSEVSMDAVWSVAYLALFPTCCAYSLQVIGQKDVPPAAASLLLSLESVFGVLASVIFYGEKLTFRLVAGFCVIFLAIVFSETNVVPRCARFLKDRAEALKTDIPALFLALRAKETPLPAKVIACVAVGYALSPIDLVPDFIPVLGYLDDVLLLPALVALCVKMIPRAVLDSCRARARDMWRDGAPVKWYYALPVVLVWLALLALLTRAVISWLN